jgi:hypothetical protein
MGAAYPSPGTIMNNRFSGPNAWDDYLTALSGPRRLLRPSRSPTTTSPIPRKSTAVQSVWSLDGRKVDFPERGAPARRCYGQRGLRQSSPFRQLGGYPARRRDPAFSVRLQFNAMHDRFDCTRADLIRLGKKANPSITDDGAALAYGPTSSR